MRAAVLTSGGKDSALALHRVINDGHDVAYLVSMIPVREGSWMFHYPNIRLVGLFAEAAGIPLIKSETRGIKEKEVEELEHLVAKLDVDCLVSGAIASVYQKARIDKICKRLGLKSVAPLWHEDTQELMKEILKLEFEAIITGVFAYGLTSKWLGRRIDTECIEDLIELNRKYGVSIVGEGGEYETIVLDATFFRKRIKIVESRKTWKNQSGYFIITKAELESK